MTGVWLDSFIRLMRNVLLWQWHNKETVYFNPFILTKNNPIAGQINTTGATSGAGTACPSGAHEFTPVFSGVCVTRSLASCVCFVDCCLSFCILPFGHGVVCYAWYTDSDYSFSIFKPFIIKTEYFTGLIINHYHYHQLFEWCLKPGFIRENNSTLTKGIFRTSWIENKMEHLSLYFVHIFNVKKTFLLISSNKSN